MSIVSSLKPTMAADDCEEIKLVQAAMAGDGAAFSDLFDRYYPMIHAFAYRLCLNSSDADEVAQETFIKAARSLKASRKGQFRAWLYRIARNCAIDHNRALDRERVLAEALLAEQEGVGREAGEVDLAPVAVALKSLKTSLRESIVLTVCEGMTHAQAAKILGCAEATVSWRVFQAKRKLRKLLGAGKS